MFRTKVTNAGSVYYSDIIPELPHCFTMRESSVEINDNFYKYCEYFKVEEKDFIHPVQTHSSNIRFAEIGEQNYPETDAIILTNTEQAVYLRFADCTPVIVYDRQANIAAAVHAGWRGTVAGILPKTIEKMLESSKSDIENVFVTIGPAIGACCYSVGDEVIQGVDSSVRNNEGLYCERSGKTFLDLKKTNARQAIESGVPIENIDICPFCTCCNNDLFYSYRKENGTDLRHNAIIKLR